MLVLIVDCSVQVINRLEEVLSEAKHIRAIHKAVSYEKAISFFKKSKPDIVLLDPDLPANKSVDLVSEIKKLNNVTAIIVLSIRTDDGTHEKFISLGADLFLDKYNDFEKLPEIVDAIGTSKKSGGSHKY
jgi:DNA-binding NarL/FixJ family response regulator